MERGEVLIRVISRAMLDETFIYDHAAEWFGSSRFFSGSVDSIRFQVWVDSFQQSLLSSPKRAPSPMPDDQTLRYVS